MEIIPVIDLMNGVAVRAERGQRERYRPLRSPLCSSPEPGAVLEGYLSVHPFKTVYLADLDALMGKGRQTAATAALIRAFPGISFWIDSGLPEPAIPGGSAADKRAAAVIGSESLGGNLKALPDPARAPFVLSLDFQGGGLLGPEALLEHPELWPEQVILMSLSRVGADQGPDFARAEEYVRAHPRRRFAVAGGVRDVRDMERLAALGVSQVLMASALHSGKVDRGVLERLG
jgi:phosphoribosylformimino-5-aminoimidazole carboxamide ribotide isomerase